MTTQTQTPGTTETTILSGVANVRGEMLRRLNLSEAEQAELRPYVAYVNRAELEKLAKDHLQIVAKLALDIIERGRPVQCDVVVYMTAADYSFTVEKVEA